MTESKLPYTGSFPRYHSSWARAEPVGASSQELGQISHMGAGIHALGTSFASLGEKSEQEPRLSYMACRNPSQRWHCDSVG